MAGRATPTWTVQVARPPEEVFAYLADVRRHHEWSPKPYRVEGLADGPVGLGTKFGSVGWVPKDADHHNTVEVTEYQPPSRLQLTADDRGQPFISTFTLTPQGGGTKVERQIDMPKPGGILFPLLLVGFLRPAIQKGMTMLKTNLEKGTGPSA